MPQEILIVPHHGREKLALSVGTFIESETGRKDGVGQFSVEITRLIISEKSPTLYGWPISCMLKMLHRIYHLVVTNSFKSFEPTLNFLTSKLSLHKRPDHGQLRSSNNFPTL